MGGDPDDDGDLPPDLIEGEGDDDTDDDDDSDYDPEEEEEEVEEDAEGLVSLLRQQPVWAADHKLMGVYDGFTIDCSTGEHLHGGGGGRRCNAIFV